MNVICHDPVRPTLVQFVLEIIARYLELGSWRRLANKRGNRLGVTALAKGGTKARDPFC